MTRPLKEIMTSWKACDGTVTDEELQMAMDATEQAEQLARDLGGGACVVDYYVTMHTSLTHAARARSMGDHKSIQRFRYHGEARTPN